MGNTPSQENEYSVGEEELRHAPHNFYLVFGKPSIRYARDCVRGPLIYDVDIEFDEDNDAIDRTATLNLSCAVPHRQPFDLIFPPPLSTVTSSGCTEGGVGSSGDMDVNSNVDRHGTAQRRGLALTFRIAANTAPRRVRVLTNVAIAYCPGVGLRLSSFDDRNSASSPSSSSGSHCVFSTTATEGLDVVVTQASVLPQQLRPTAWETPQNVIGSAAAPRVTYAPLVIEVDVGDTEEPLPGSNRYRNHRSADAMNAATKTSQQQQQSSQRTGDGPSSSLPSSSSSIPTSLSPPSRKRVIQYTLLEVPSGAAETFAAATASRDEAATTGAVKAALRIHCKVCKQLLQVGSEVYDLQDVFDVGREDEGLTNPQAESDEDEDLCVICLTNERNTTILPCRHMCLCSECAMQLRLSNNRCPMCRGNIDRLVTL